MCSSSSSSSYIVGRDIGVGVGYISSGYYREAVLVCSVCACLYVVLAKAASA